MQAKHALVALILGLNGYSVLAAPTFGSISDAIKKFMGGMGGKGGPAGGLTGGLLGGNAPPSKPDIADAAMLWQGDTVTVSKFLSSAESLSPQELQVQGQIALDAAKDELVQKAVLDRVFVNGTDENRVPAVVEAEDTLANQGTFPFVEDTLVLFSKRGSKLKPDEVATLIKAVNQDRCFNVLPAIDAYLSAAQDMVMVGNGNGTLKAVRPDNC